MIVARMKRLSTPVALAMSTIDSWIAAVSSSVLRATSQVSQDASITSWLAANLGTVSLRSQSHRRMYSHVVEGEPVRLGWPSFSRGAVTGVTLVSLCGV